MRELTTVTSSLDFWPALMLLLSIAFGPTYIALTVVEIYSINSNPVNKINGGVLIVFAIFFLINAFSIGMLNRVYSSKKLGSFQEMAWSTSNGNRGYIFLISAMKVIYLVTTSAYCISFVACFFTGIVQMYAFPQMSQCSPGNICPEFTTDKAGVTTTTKFEDFIGSMNWISYGIYAFWVIVISAIAYEVQKNKEPQNIYNYQQVPKIFFGVVCVSLGLMIIGVILVSIDNGF